MHALMARLGLSQEDQALFGMALIKGNAGINALVATPNTPKDSFLFVGQETKMLRGNIIEWLPEGVCVRMGEEKAGTLEGYAEGAFYPLDLSSVWEGSILKAWNHPVRRFLDMCAAPGGKSLLCGHIMCPEEHYANEVEAGRLNILRHNLHRCGYINKVFTQRLQPREWADGGAESFDFVWVDAPCSGQSLLAKGIKNLGCFHPAIVKGNAKRQRGILSSSASCVASGGGLAYSTCSFSIEENEGNVAWFLKRHPEFSLKAVPHLAPWQSCLSEAPMYRLLPQHGLGAGGFVVLFVKDGDISAELPILSAKFSDYPVA